MAIGDRKKTIDARALQPKQRLVGLVALALFAALVGLTAMLKAPPPPPLIAPQAVGALPWSELRPQAASVPGLPDAVDLASLRDSDPRATQILRAMREAADAAPLVERLHGQQVALAGYVVPLDGAGAGLTEFLLVPYFGACIHSPPPPPNQVVHVLAKAGANLRTMDQVLVRGRIEVARASFSLAASGYRINDAQVEIRNHGTRTGIPPHPGNGQ